MSVSLVLLVETMLLQAWLRGEVREKLPLIAVVPFVLVGTAWLGFEALIRLNEWSERRLKLASRAVWLRPSRPERIPWKRIAQWEFEPVAHRQHLTKLTLVSTWGKRQRRWPMILSSHSDTEKLKRELEKRKQDAAFQIIVHPKPLPPAPPKKIPSLSGAWLMAVGFYLFVHGAPLLVASVDDSAQSGREVTLSQSAREFVSARFANAKDYRRFLRYSGSILTGVGLISCIGGYVLAAASKGRPV